MDNNDQNNGGAPADQTPTQDDQEWEQALDSYQKDRGVDAGAAKDGGADDGKQQTEEEKKAAEDKVVADKKVADEAAAKKTADEAEAEKVKTETPEQTKARHEEQAKADAKAKADAEAAARPDDPTVRTARATQREIAQQEAEMKDDIRKELFSDVQTKLLDSDGDEIKSIEDVQKLKNPNTGKAFTEDEAAAWLLKAQQNLNKNLQETESKIDAIAAVNLDLHDQADSVKARFGALLKTMPDIAKKIVTSFNETLETDPKTGYILKAPMNMERFFELALEPYALQDKQLQALNEQELKQQAAKKETDRKQTRQDRSDIYGGGKVETMDDEEKEWAKAAEDYYGKK